MIEMTLVSMGPLTEWGPGKTDPVDPLSQWLLLHSRIVNFINYQNYIIYLRAYSIKNELKLHEKRLPKLVLSEKGLSGGCSPSECSYGLVVLSYKV